MIRISYHPDLAGFTQFEKLVLALGRWPQFFLLSLSWTQVPLSEVLDKEISELIQGFRNLELDPMEKKLTEILALTGRGKNKVLNH